MWIVSARPPHTVTQSINTNGSLWSNPCFSPSSTMAAGYELLKTEGSTSRSISISRGFRHLVLSSLFIVGIIFVSVFYIFSAQHARRFSEQSPIGDIEDQPLKQCVSGLPLPASPLQA
ncbi:hypothetical protein A0H81_02186 [Grifola frondosa]|uniref:Uncharacterized protein n=1 Tax=Grifola frondosa TaxID=5627 RepID=A0A1C7MTV6_GRIFR|nr:hypothetical protein A0H81_02186 [Grifola frondosa]